jgi:hypothetical protein
MDPTELPAPPLPRAPSPAVCLPARLPPPPRAGHLRRRSLAAIALTLCLLTAAAGAALAAWPQGSRDQARASALGSRAYAFIGRTTDGEPYRWDPCSPIRYQVDLGSMPESTLEDVREAVRRTSNATGLRFEFTGLVNESPIHIVNAADFVDAVPMEGLAWSPLTIAFVSRRVVHKLGAQRALGAAFPVTTRMDRAQYVSGLIVINVDAGLAPGFSLGPSVGPTILHELGHIVGLAHVLNPFQLVSPSPIRVDWGNGDTAGLRELGQGPCLDVPTPELFAVVFP